LFTYLSVIIYEKWSCARIYFIAYLVLPSKIDSVLNIVLFVVRGFSLVPLFVTPQAVVLKVARSNTIFRHILRISVGNHPLVYSIFANGWLPTDDYHMFKLQYTRLVINAL